MAMRRPAVLLLAAVLIPLAVPAQTGEETFGESIDVRVVNVVGADESTRVRSRVTVQLRSIKQRLVFQLRDPQSGGSFVTEVSYLPGK
jgi:hypothetical protein